MGSACSRRTTALPVHTTIHNHYYQHQQHDRNFVAWLCKQREQYHFSNEVFQQILLRYTKGGHISEYQWQSWFEREMKYQMDRELKQLQSDYESRLRNAEKREDQLRHVIESYRQKQKHVYVRYLLNEDERQQYIHSHHVTQVHNHTSHPVIVQPTFQVQLQGIREREEDYVNWLWHRYENNYITREEFNRYAHRHMAGRWYHNSYAHHRRTKRESRRYRIETEKYNMLAELHDNFEIDLNNKEGGITKLELQRMLYDYRRKQQGILHGTYAPQYNQPLYDDPEYVFVNNLVDEEGEENRDVIARRLMDYLIDHWRENFKGDESDEEMTKWMDSFSNGFVEKVKEKTEENIDEEELAAMLKLYKFQLKQQAKTQTKKQQCFQNILDSDEKFVNNLPESEMFDEEMARKMMIRLRKMKQLEGYDESEDDNDSDENLPEDENESDEMKAIREEAENELKHLEDKEISREALLALLEKYRRKQMELISNEGKYIGTYADEDEDSEDEDDTEFVDKISAIDLSDAEKIAQLLRQRLLKGRSTDDSDDNTLFEKEMNDIQEELGSASTLTKEQILALLMKYRYREKHRPKDDESPQDHFEDDANFVENLPDSILGDPELVKRKLLKRLHNLDNVMDENNSDEDDDDGKDRTSYVDLDESESEDEDEPHKNILTEEIPEIESLMNDPEYMKKVEELNKEYEMKMAALGDDLTKNQLLELMMEQRQKIADLIAAKETKESQTEKDPEEVELQEIVERKRRGSISEDEYNDLLKDYLQNVDALKDHKSKEKDRLNDKLKAKLKERAVRTNSSETDSQSTIEEDIGQSEDLTKLDNTFEDELEKKVKEGVSETDVQDIIAKHKQEREQLIHEKQERQKKQMNQLNEKLAKRKAAKEFAPEKKNTKQREKETEQQAGEAIAGHKKNKEQLQKMKDEEKKKHETNIQEKLKKKKTESTSPYGESLRTTTDEYGSLDDYMQAMLQSDGKVAKFKAILTSDTKRKKLTQYLEDQSLPSTSE